MNWIELLGVAMLGDKMIVNKIDENYFIQG